MKNQHLKTIINPLVGSCPTVINIQADPNQPPIWEKHSFKSNKSFVQTIHFIDKNGILIKRSIKHHNI